MLVKLELTLLIEVVGFEFPYTAMVLTHSINLSLEHFISVIRLNQHYLFHLKFWALSFDMEHLPSVVIVGAIITELLDDASKVRTVWI